MATSYIPLEQQTVIQFCFESGMSPLDTLNLVKQVEYHMNVSQALVYELLWRFREGTAASERMVRPQLRNTGKDTKTELVVSIDDKWCAT